jgi:hypothetical protein
VTFHLRVILRINIFLSMLKYFVGTSADLFFMGMNNEFFPCTGQSPKIHRIVKKKVMFTFNERFIIVPQN